VRLLLEDYKFDINANSRTGTALHWAAERGREAVVRLLLDYKSRRPGKGLKRHDGATMGDGGNGERVRGEEMVRYEGRVRGSGPCSTQQKQVTFRR
jgi:ankyrin repeat protein